jgi:hypothetical protein
MPFVNQLATAKAGRIDRNSGFVRDAMDVLPGGAVRFSGFFDRYIELSRERWIEGALPYAALADFFAAGRPLEGEGQQVEMFAAGEMWGKAVRSACLFYRYKPDLRLRDVLTSTVYDLLSKRRANGALSCSPVDRQPDGPMGDLWERKYVLLGLDEYYSCVDADANVLSAMVAEADATLQQVGLPPKKRIVDLGWSSNHIESSAILEPIVRLYKRTGFERYRAFARYIVEVEGGALHHRVFDEVLAGLPPMEIGGVYPKAYEMTSLFEGLAEYYRVTGNPRWLKVCQQYFRQIIKHEITIVGNGGGDQPYHPNVEGEAWDNTAFEQTNPDVKRMMETCTGVTWLKFCHQMLRLTGQSIATDYIETYVYNGLIGAQKPEGDGFSYVNLLNGIKTNKTGWGTVVDGVYVTCCNLNGPEGLAYLPLIAVMSNHAGPVVNFFNAGTAKVALGVGNWVDLGIESSYPVEGGIRIRVRPSSPARFDLQIRIPTWSEQTQLRVNGEPRDVNPGRYAHIERDWHSGDVVDLALDMRTRVIPAPNGIHEGSRNFVALRRGPLVLARDENIDPHFSEAVDVIAEDGSVPAKAESPANSTIQMRVPTARGDIQMVDYASVNSWSGKRIQTWLPRRSAAGE